MSFFWIAVVHWLHVMGGAVWFGGTIVFAFAVWPALLRRPAIESKAIYDTLVPAVGVVFAIAANLTLWLGLLRGTLLGPIQSFETLMKTPYGHTFMTALVLTIVFMIYGGRVRVQVEKRVWNGDQYYPGAASFIWRSNMIGVVLLLAIVACMVAMRFGL